MFAISNKKRKQHTITPWIIFKSGFSVHSSQVPASRQSGAPCSGKNFRRPPILYRDPSSRDPLQKQKTKIKKVPFVSSNIPTKSVFLTSFYSKSSYNPHTTHVSCRRYSCHGHPASGTSGHSSCNAASRENAGIHGLLLSINHPFVSIGRLKPHRRHLAGNSIL